MTDADTVIEARDVARHYPLSGRFGRLGGGPPRMVKAVDGVSLSVRRGETLAIVGESGCGKSTLARLLLRLERPDEGQVWFDGGDLARLDERRMRPLRRKLQIVFQDPFSSLNPRMTVGQIIEEPLIVHGLGDAAARRRRVREIMDLVGLSAGRLGRYPHEFSGGQRQRIGIARALVSGPEVVIGDEPVSALDVSVQAQVINLLEDLKSKLGLTLVIITHDLAVVRHMADRVGVMYLGRMAELAPTAELFAQPRHPYTQALLAAVPRPDPTRRAERPPLEGDLPSPVAPPPGCRFHTRCPYAQDNCRTDVPDLLPASGAAHVACHYWRTITPPEATIVTAQDTGPSRRMALWMAARERQDASIRMPPKPQEEVTTS
jgi:oligopeptide/dipeptide ABC transporter ATP-binding protein